MRLVHCAEAEAAKECAEQVRAPAVMARGHQAVPGQQSQAQQSVFLHVSWDSRENNLVEQHRDDENGKESNAEDEPERRHNGDDKVDGGWVLCSRSEAGRRAVAERGIPNAELFIHKRERKRERERGFEMRCHKCAIA